MKRAPSWLIGMLCLSAGIAPSGCDDSAAPPATAPSAAAIEASLSAATHYIDSQELSKARTILEELIERAPREARAHEMLGQTLFLQAAEARGAENESRRGELLAAAYSRYASTAELEPASAGLQHSAYLMAKSAGAANQALRHVLKAAELEPANPQYSLHAAQELLARGRLNEAAEAVARVLAVEPDEPFAHATLAMIAMERHQAEQSVGHILRARALDPASVPLRVAESRIRRWNQQPREAIEALIGLDERTRAQEAVAHEIASAYSMLAQPAKAAEAWEVVHRRDAGNWRAAVHAGEQRLAAGEIATAAAWLDAARVLAPTEESVTKLRQAIARAASWPAMEERQDSN